MSSNPAGAATARPPPALLRNHLDIGNCRVAPMSAASAREIVGWRYAEPFADASFHADALPILIDPAERYHVVSSPQHEVAACFCLGESARLPGIPYGCDDRARIDIGFARHPRQVVRGSGTALLRFMLDYVTRTYGYRRFRATTGDFNHAVWRVLANVGFKPQRQFRSSAGRIVVHATPSDEKTTAGKP